MMTVLGLAGDRAHDPIADQYAAIMTGDLSLAARAVARDWVNREAEDEPPSARRGGPVGLAVTAAWLRSAFSDIVFREVERVTEGDTVVSRVEFSARQTGPLVLFDGERSTVFPPTGRAFAVEQVHIHRLRDGAVVAHLARRDDLGMMRQLGHVPPRPTTVLRMIWWRVTGRASRAGQRAIDLGEFTAAAMDRWMRSGHDPSSGPS